MKVRYFESSEGTFPVKEFVSKLNNAEASKTYFYFTLLAEHNGSLRGPFSKHLNGGIFELRPTKNGVTIRVLYFFSAKNEAILTNAFIKKTKKTPPSEIALAKKRRALHLSREG